MALLKTRWIYAMTLIAGVLLGQNVFAQSILGKEKRPLPISEILSKAENEKKLIEKSYRANQAAERAEERRIDNGERTISVVLGDGLAPEGNVAARAKEQAYREEKEAVAKLEHEWKEVNKAVERALIEKAASGQ